LSFLKYCIGTKEAFHELLLRLDQTSDLRKSISTPTFSASALGPGIALVNQLLNSLVLVEGAGDSQIIPLRLEFNELTPTNSGKVPDKIELTN
jgi:hypothetical protein